MPKPKQRVVIVGFNQDKMQEAVDALNNDNYRVSHAVFVEGEIQLSGDPQTRARSFREARRRNFCAVSPGLAATERLTGSGKSVALSDHSYSCAAKGQSC